MRLFNSLSIALWWFVAICLVGFLLFGCRAKKEIQWDEECARRYPIKEKIIKGETVYYTDTIIEPGLIIQADPILLKVKCPDSKVITKTISRVDTIIKENTAQIKLLEREKEESDTKYQAEQEKRLTAEETAQKSNRRLTYAVLVILGGICFTFRKQLIGLFKIFI